MMKLLAIFVGCVVWVLVALIGLLGVAFVFGTNANSVAGVAFATFLGSLLGSFAAFALFHWITKEPAGKIPYVSLALFITVWMGFAVLDGVGTPDMWFRLFSLLAAHLGLYMAWAQLGDPTTR